MHTSSASAPAADSTDFRWRTAWLLFTAGCALRLLGLGRQSLWYDEVLSIKEASYSWADLLDPSVYKSVHPPFFFLVLKCLLPFAEGDPAWRDFVLRLPAALAAGALAVGLYGAGCRMGGARLGLCAGLMSLPSAFILYHAQECRMYTFGMLFVVMMVWAALRAFASPRHTTRWLLLYLASVLAFGTHWFAVSVWPALLCYGILHSRTRRVCVGLSVVTAALIASIVAYLWLQYGDLSVFGRWGGADSAAGAGSSSAAEPDSSAPEHLAVSMRHILALLWGLWAGHGIGPTDVDFGSRGMMEQLAPFWWSLGLAALCALTALIGVCISLKRVSQHRLLLAFLLAWAAIGVIAPVLAVHDYARPRYAFVAMPALLLLLALSLQHARARSVQAMILVPCLFVQCWASGAQLLDQDRWHPDFRAAVASVTGRPQLRGRVACSRHSSRFLRAYSAEERIGPIYWGKGMNTAELVAWAQTNTRADGEVAFLVDWRFDRAAAELVESLDRELELLESRRWRTLEQRRYRRRAPR